MPRPKPSLRRRLLFALVPLLGLLLLAELAIRLVRAPLFFGSFRELRTDLMRRNYPAELHPTLGYVPKPNFESRDNHWGTVVTIDADGLRANGAPPPAGDDVVLTVGDSFTFGDEVDDDEAWPAQLERILQRPVRNGGVFGYSFVQMVLRAELLLERMPVTKLIVSFIPDDLTRGEYSRRYTPVPFFDLVDGQLLLRNVPIDHTAATHGDSDKAVKDALGHSALVDAVLANVARQWWFENEKQVRVPHLTGQGDEIAMALVERLLQKCRERSARLVLVLQDRRPTPEALAVLRHAESLGVPTLDLASRFQGLRTADPSLEERYFDGHMTEAGNRWVAEQVAELLRSLR